MLAAAAGGWAQVDPDLSFAMAFHARGNGTDLETYHPLDPSGQKAPPAPRNRDFLADVTLLVWLFDDLETWRARLRRPVWPLRLGRSQDLIGIQLETVPVISRPGVQGAAVVPEPAGSKLGTHLRLPTAIRPGKTHTRWGSYRFDASGKAAIVLDGSLSTADGQALFRLPSPHPDTVPDRRPAGRHGASLRTVLTTLLAKSQPPELLTDHLYATLRSAGEVQRRIGRLDTVDSLLGERFWTAVKLAGLTHDAGKILDGFQDMVTGRTRAWGQRHEVPSLGFLPHLIEDPELLVWTATGVATHHRALTAEEGGRDLQTLYANDKPHELATRLGPISSDAPEALAQWLHATAASAGLPLRRAPGDLPSMTLLTDAYDVLTSVLQQWEDEVSEKEGLAAVLLQGAVTLADHLSSAHTPLSLTQPLDGSFRPLLDEHLAGKNASLRPHQKEAGQVAGDMLLRAPTGSGKTEAALLWAHRQVTDQAADSGGVPRVFYTLPYLSSINVMTKRLADLLGDDAAVGVAHSRAASYHLAQAIAPQDGCETQTSEQPNGSSRADAAAKAVSRAAATRLFHETLRVGTPYQLLRAALAGPAHSSTLLDLTNSVFILDELHAYDPQRLGYILAGASMWKRLGGRIAVLSATLPDALAELFTDALGQQPQPVEAPYLGLPPRHRLSTRSHHLTEYAAIEEIQQRLDNDESVLVVANNVAHALKLYEDLAPHVTEHHGQDSALLLHSRYKRGDRMAIEKSIQDRFGSDRDAAPGYWWPHRSLRCLSMSTSTSSSPQRRLWRRCCSASAEQTASVPGQRPTSSSTNLPGQPGAVRPVNSPTASTLGNPSTPPGRSSLTTMATPWTSATPQAGSTTSTLAPGARTGARKSPTTSASSKKLFSPSATPSTTATSSPTPSTASSTAPKPSSNATATTTNPPSKKAPRQPDDSSPTTTSSRSPTGRPPQPLRPETQSPHHQRRLHQRTWPNRRPQPPHTRPLPAQRGPVIQA